MAEETPVADKPTYGLKEISKSESIAPGGHIRGAYTTNLIRKAIEEGWHIEDEDRAFVVSEMMKILRESKSPRNRQSAAKVLVAMTGINARLMSIDQKSEMGPNQINILNQVGTIGGGNLDMEKAMESMTVEELELFKKLQAKASGALPDA